MKKKMLCAAAVLLLALAAGVFGMTAGASGDLTDYLPTVSDSTLMEQSPETEHIEQVAQTVEGTNVRARVVEVIENVHDVLDLGGYTYANDYQVLLLEVLEGAYKGQQLEATYDITDTWGGGNAPRALEVGDRVFAQFTMEADGHITGIITQYIRTDAVLWLAVIFVIALIFFGGKRGLRSVIALVMTCVGLIFVMVPAMTNGMNPVLAAVLGSIFSIAVTLILIYGFSVKTLAAALGAGGGVIAAGIITAIMNAAMKMTGLVDEEAMYLAQSVGFSGRLDLRGILLAAILISVLGGTMDVGISIASALDELRINAPDITGAELMKSGINIGIDIMGASLNTLILAYGGGSIHLLMLFNTYDYSLMMILNDEMIASQLLQALAGSMALLLTVPISSLVAAALMCKGNFGTLSADCFAGVVICRRAVNGVRSFVQGIKAKAQARSREDEEIPEDLYAAVQRHMENMDEVGADYFGGDIDEDGLYEELRENNRKNKPRSPGVTGNDGA